MANHGQQEDTGATKARREEKAWLRKAKAKGSLSNFQTPTWTSPPVASAAHPGALAIASPGQHGGEKLVAPQPTPSCRHWEGLVI